MADISKIKLPSGSTYDIVDKKSGYKVVSINRKVDSGVNIADITIGDTTTQLYAPQGGGAGTVTSVGVSNATNGGLSVSGSPVTSSGTITIGHSNVLSSAQTTQAVYPIKIDKNGHISAYGSAVTIPNISVGYISGSAIYAAPDTKYSYSGSSEFTGLFLFTVPSSATQSESANKTVSSVKIGTNTINISSHTFNTAGLYSAYVSDNVLVNVQRIQAPPITDVTVGGTSVVSVGVAAIPAIPTKVSDLTNDSGFVTTDEKLKADAVSNDLTSSFFPVVTANSSTASTKKYFSTWSASYSDNATKLTIKIGNGAGVQGYLGLANSTSGYTTISSIATTSRTITLPDTTGTLALTSDIPTVPTSAGSATTGVTIADHSSTTIYGVQSSTTSVTGVQSSTTTASKVTLGTAISVPNVTAAGSGSFAQGSFSGGSLTMSINATDSSRLDIVFTPATHGADSHTHTPPTLGTAKSIPNVTGVSDVTVPIKNTSATTVPIKNPSTTTVITSKTHTVTDNGHTHSLS